MISNLLKGFRLDFGQELAEVFRQLFAEDFTVNKLAFARTRESAKPLLCAHLLGVINGSESAHKFAREFIEPLERETELPASTVPPMWSGLEADESFMGGRTTS
jgi:hypothetical protein